MPLLLHSLTFYSDLLTGLAGLLPNPHVVEVGSEHSHMSELLARSTASRGGSLYVVEPNVSAKLRSLTGAHPNIEVIEGRSPEALAKIPPAGLYLLDGDHNYYVVSRELESIFDRPDGDSPLAVMHDIGWPCARRDFYYSPSSLPPEAVKEHSFERGVVLDQPELAPPGRGFRSEGAYAIALEEGGPGNGVLTALEDFLRDRPHLEALTTPLVFGLAVVGDRTCDWWPRVVEAMRPYTENPTLAEVERNRVELYLEVLDVSDRYGEIQRRRAKRQVFRRLTKN